MTKETRTLLNEAARMNGIEATLAYDLYVLLRQRGAGIPTDDRIVHMAKIVAKKSNGEMSQNTASVLMRKRKQQLKTMIKTVVFKTLSKRKDSIEALRLFVINFQMLHRKVRQSECVTCKLMKNCDFGKQYATVVRDITKVLDPDYAQKAHADCPSLPEIESTNRIASAAEVFAKMCKKGPTNTVSQNLGKDPNYTTGELTAKNPKEELKQVTKEQEESDKEGEDEEDDETPTDTPDNETPMWATTFGSDQAHLGGVYEGKHAGNNFQLQQDLIQKLLVSNLVVFDLGKKFSMALLAQKKGKFSPTSKIDASTSQRNIERISDITKLQSSQHGLPEESFNEKLAKRDLVKVQNMSRTEKKKLLYAILDVSGSMSGWLGGGNNPHKILTRGALAATLMIAIAERVQQDGGIMFLRFFADAASNLVQARIKDEFERLSYLIANSAFNGGGTDILKTLGHTVDDIKRATDEIASAEILAVTDCEDTFDVDAVQKTIKGQEFNVLDVSGGAFSSQGASGQLKACATHYYKASEQAVDVDKIIAIV